MASEDTAIDTSALVPAIWSARMQIPLTKSLVALAVCSTDLQKELKVGDTIHKGYIGVLSAVTYTPGNALTAQNYTAVDDTILVQTMKAVPFYVDDIDMLQAKTEYVSDLAEDAAYQLRDVIDAEVLGEVTAGIAFGESTATTGTYITGTAIQEITATSANIDDVFVAARKSLREGNVEEAGDWIAIMHPHTAQYIELLGIDKGFNVADSTLHNGYAGDFLGFKIYISNNLTANHMYLGKKGAIDLVMQVAPKMVIKSVHDKIGRNFIAYTVYGKTVFTRNASRFLDVDIETE